MYVLEHDVQMVMFHFVLAVLKLMVDLNKIIIVIMANANL